ncbi:GtrA family protein [Terasakiella sp. A23]|uniref:GtrA family protein n=1 Tax=Terasakiella sp. FCG-A23 TaxID=3080561 RepID=UPI00295526DE|nr:GtrA family protein [Terasakiella sp. A23]MDV7340833.1 GtrA family protein [Terasakiella sp. A23]
MKKEMISFLIVGLINTVIHWLVYWGALSFMSHQPAFAIAFAVGTGISWALNSKKTFDVDLNARKLMLYFAFYGFSYLIGRTVLYVCVDLAGIDRYPAILIVTLVGIPINFVGSRLVLKGSLRN